MNEIDRVLERINQSTAARMAAARERRALMTAGVTRVDRSPAIGARVFDTVSGEEGTVLGGGSENVVVSDPRR